MIWYSVVNDIGLYLGDMMISRSSRLQWVFFDKLKDDAAYQLKVAGHLGRWMACMDIEATHLDRTRIEAFVSTLRDRGSRRVPGLRSFAPLLDYLASQGVVVVKTPPLTPVEAVVSDYHRP
ncbi:MAG: hypothetical protein LC749_16370 [Actinobacteria bacterium]|nr:hypothetical protein [Actinomycetota bacterium]